ncbi:hypothetical protein FJZ36_03010 [Candidatus Poribacteria bacterium]|nr:hypothetical protein [Candidatus Poribacteria bacterium]
MESPILEATRDIVVAYIGKYPTGQSAYSANIEAAMNRMRQDILAFTRDVYATLERLESGAEPPPPPDPMG